ncbi:MAG: Fe-S-containing hydro-lyase [Smithellaceae bacterium]|nr:Fe-S-containing hydro-lyase [Smithellaceae bacterium]
MSKTIELTTPLTDEVLSGLKAGDAVLISGDVYTARDAAHRRMVEALDRGEALPVDLKGKVIFYAAPTPAPPGKVIGSIGPTTSYRMDPFTKRLLDLGLKGMIGKGKRAPEIMEALKAHRAVYFGAIGGIAALMSRCITKVEPIAYADLGPEAIVKLTLNKLPVVVIGDTRGGNLYESLP